MTTALYMHDDCYAHVTPAGHPERVERLEAVAVALSEDRFADLQKLEAPLATRAELLRCHPESYVAKIEAAIPAQGSRALDADTHVSAGSWAAALRAVGAAGAAVDAVMAGDVANVFCATRPPGHHAETAKPMGFCLFGTAAIAAKRALDHHGLSRVAVVDFDVHHGKGLGPMAEMLAIDTPDLTGLSKRNNGVFPTEAVAMQIDGRSPLLAHGGEMPIFGPSLESDQNVALRLESGQSLMTGVPLASVIVYLESLQQK